MTDRELAEMCEKIKRGETFTFYPSNTVKQHERSKTKTAVSILVSAIVSVITSLIILHFMGIVDLSKVL